MTAVGIMFEPTWALLVCVLLPIVALVYMAAEVLELRWFPKSCQPHVRTQSESIAAANPTAAANLKQVGRPKAPGGPRILTTLPLENSIRDEPLTAAQHAAWETMCQTEVGRRFEADDVLRALVFCQHDCSRAEKHLASSRKWLDEFNPSAIRSADVANSLPSRCWVLGGVSRVGWRILECRVNRWKPNEYDVAEHQRLIGYLFHHAASTPSADRFCVLFDMHGWHLGFASPHCNSMVFAMIGVAQGAYCERLGVALVFNVPFLFRATWAIIKPLLDKRTTSRVFLYGRNDWQAAMAEAVDDANRPVVMGGMAAEGTLPED